MDTQLDLSIKLYTKRNAQFLSEIDFPEFQLDGHDDDQIKATIAVLSPCNPQVIEGELWYKTDKELFCEDSDLSPFQNYPQALLRTQ